MAKIIWWITTFIACLINSVSPFHMEEVGFVIDGYYTSTEGVAQTPWSIYSSFFTTDEELKMACDPRHFTIATSTGAFKTSFGGYTTIKGRNNMYYYPLAVPQSVADSFKGSNEEAEKYLYTYEIPADTFVPIIAPTRGQIKTSLLGSDHCQSMVFTMGAWELTFTNMECWYCDYNHGKNGSNYKHAMVDDSDFKGYYAGGEVLGVANSDTVVRVRYMNSDGKYITKSLDDIYYPEEHTDTKFTTNFWDKNRTNPS